MIKVPINIEQRKELEQFRALASSKDSEKALMVLLLSLIRQPKRPKSMFFWVEI